MSTHRDVILGKVKKTLEALPERAAYPDYDTEVVVTIPEDADLWEHFKTAMQAVNGKVYETTGKLKKWMLENDYLSGYCDPELLEIFSQELGPEITLETTYDRERIDEYQFGITRASGAIAESGTIILKDGSTSSRLGSLTPWVHITVLRSDEVYRDIPTALDQLGDDPNIIWVTGPSKTADIEGILIEGVHGPGEQVCLRLDS
jgi:L-lactate dehydrogenase complex protein LldG